MTENLGNYVQTGISTVCVAVVLWAGVAINTAQQSDAAIAVELRHIKADLSDIKTDLATRTIRDGREFKTLEKRVWALEVRNRTLLPVGL